MQPGLAPVDELHGLAVEKGVVLSAEGDFLATPFRNSLLGGQFNGPGRVRSQAIGAFVGWSLIVPEANGRACAVPMLTNRVAVDGRFQAGRDGFLPGARQYLVA